MLLDLDAAVRKVPLGKSTLRRLVAGGELKAVRIGRRLFFRREDLAAFVQARLTKQRQGPRA
jgi:excisionase family DNA binding protein